MQTSLITYGVFYLLSIGEDWCPLLSVIDNIWITYHTHPQPPVFIFLNPLTKLPAIFDFFIEYIADVLYLEYNSNEVKKGKLHEE